MQYSTPASPARSPALRRSCRTACSAVSASASVDAPPYPETHSGTSSSSVVWERISAAGDAANAKKIRIIKNLVRCIVCLYSCHIYCAGQVSVVRLWACLELPKIIERYLSPAHKYFEGI